MPPVKEKRKTQSRVVATRSYESPSPNSVMATGNPNLASAMIVRLVSPYTLIILIMLDFLYLLVEVFSFAFLPLQLVLYGLAATGGFLIVFASEFLTNKYTTLGEKLAVAFIGGLIAALPFPVLGVGMGAAGLVMQYLAAKKQSSDF